MVELTTVRLYFHLEQLAATSNFYSVSVVTPPMLPSSSKEFLLSRVFFLSSPSHILPLCSLEYCIIIWNCNLTHKEDKNELTLSPSITPTFCAQPPDTLISISDISSSWWTCVPCFFSKLQAPYFFFVVKFPIMRIDPSQTRKGATNIKTKIFSFAFIVFFQFYVN